jgi:hypothetical protein
MAIMLTVTRTQIASGALLAAVGLSALAPPAASLTRASAVTSTPHDYITLLAGSPQYAAYELTHYLPSDAPTSPPTSAPYELVVRAKDGSSQDYPLTPADSSLMVSRWSLAGDMLTTLDGANHKTVHWWNLATHASGTITIPGKTYVAASPNGVLYMPSSGELDQRTTTGAMTVLSRMFSTRPKVLTGFSNASGVVVSASKGIARYLAFAHPHKVVKLATIGKAVVTCWALSKSYAACTQFGAKAGRPTKAALLPLNGHVATQAKDSRENFGAVGIIGQKRLAWTRFLNAGAHSTVGFRSAGSSHLGIASRKVDFGHLVSAYGEILVLTPLTRHSILASANGKTFSTLVKAPANA